MWQSEAGGPEHPPGLYIESCIQSKMCIQTPMAEVGKDIQPTSLKELAWAFASLCAPLVSGEKETGLQ